VTPEEERLFIARRQGRNVALGLLLAGLAVLFFAITVVRMKV